MREEGQKGRLCMSRRDGDYCRAPAAYHIHGHSHVCGDCLARMVVGSWQGVLQARKELERAEKHFERLMVHVVHKNSETPRPEGVNEMIKLTEVERRYLRGVLQGLNLREDLMGAMMSRTPARVELGEGGIAALAKKLEGYSG